MLLESFVSLLVVSAIGGYVVKMFLRPLSAVRFSSVALLNSGRRRVQVSDEDEASLPDGSPDEAKKKVPTPADAENGAAGRSGSPPNAKPPQSPPPSPPGAPSRSISGRSLGLPAGMGRPVGHLSKNPVDASRHGPPPSRQNKRRMSHTSAPMATSDGEGYRYLTFRMVRQGRVQLRDVRVQMQAQYWVHGSTAFGDRDSHKGRVVSLELEQNYFTTLEQLQCWHRIDEESPLWKMRKHLSQHLDGIEVSVNAFDMASLQQVMFYKRYERTDVQMNCVFENTLVPSSRRAGNLEADHSKLDHFVAEDITFANRPKARPKFISQDIIASSLSSIPAALMHLKSATHLPTHARENSNPRIPGDPDATVHCARQLQTPTPKLRRWSSEAHIGLPGMHAISRLPGMHGHAGTSSSNHHSTANTPGQSGNGQAGKSSSSSQSIQDSRRNFHEALDDARAESRRRRIPDTNPADAPLQLPPSNARRGFFGAPSGESPAIVV